AGGWPPKKSTSSSAAALPRSTSGSVTKRRSRVCRSVPPPAPAGLVSGRTTCGTSLLLTRASLKKPLTRMRPLNSTVRFAAAGGGGGGGGAGAGGGAAGTCVASDSATSTICTTTPGGFPATTVSCPGSNATVSGVVDAPHRHDDARSRDFSHGDHLGAGAGRGGPRDRTRHDSRARQQARHGPERRSGVDRGAPGLAAGFESTAHHGYRDQRQDLRAARRGRAGKFHRPL